MRSNSLYVFLGLVVIVGIGIILYNNYRPHTKVIDVGYQGKALLNPYLASQRFFEVLGRDVKSVRKVNPEDLWGGPTLLMTPVDNLHLRDDDFYLLEEWVAEGHHLVTGFTPNTPVQEVLPPLQMELLGLYSLRGRDTFSGNQYHINIPGMTAGVNVITSPSHLLFPKHTVNERVTYGKDNMVWWYRRDYGAGTVTVFSDYSVLETENMKQHDFAYLLQDIHDQDPRGDVLICYRREHLGIMKALWLNLPNSLVFFSLWLVIFLLIMSRRFGPLLSSPSTEQSMNIREHLRAAARVIPFSSSKSIEK